MSAVLLPQVQVQAVQAAEGPGCSVLEVPLRNNGIYLGLQNTMRAG